MINYTFIIPHKNSHLLLERCLKSIPQREDLDIIVVDDNSDDFKAVESVVRDFSRASLYKNDGYGAGGARNTGLLKAKGKWLLFADCDDYYVEGFLDELDKYVTSDYDVIYFNFYKYLEGKDEIEDEKISNNIKKYKEGKLSIDYVKYRNNAPWNKMIRNDFVVFHKIRFEEQPIGNDMFFSIQIGYLCKNFVVVDIKLYNYIVYKRSLTKSNWDVNKIKTYLENKQKYNGFMEFVNHKEWTHGFPFLCVQLYHFKDLKLAIKVLVYYFKHLDNFYAIRSKYPDELRQKLSNTRS